MPASEHSLRRKTPNGTLTAAYDGTPSGPTSDQHVAKQVLVSAQSSHAYEPKIIAGQIRPGKSFTARERDCMLSQELQQANYGLQNFAFGPAQDKSCDGSSNYHTYNPAPQVDSVLHGSPLSFDTFSRPWQFHGAPNGFLAPVQAPLGPTASDESGPYGPYWPNGTYVPYQPAVQEDRGYLPRDEQPPFTLQNSNQTGRHASSNTGVLYRRADASHPTDHQQFANFPPSHVTPSNRFIGPLMNGPNSRIFASPARDHPCHYYQPLESCTTCLSGNPRNIESGFNSDAYSTRKPAAQDRMFHIPPAILSPTPSSPPNHVLSWAHSVYARFVRALQQQAQAVPNVHSQKPRALRDNTQQTTIFPKPLRSSSKHLTNYPSTLVHPFIRSPRECSWNENNYPELHGGSVKPNSASDQMTWKPQAAQCEMRDPWSDDFVLRASADKALDLLANISQDSSNRIEALLLGGCLAYVLGDFQQALRWYTRILDLDAK